MEQIKNRIRKRKDSWGTSEVRHRRRMEIFLGTIFLLDVFFIYEHFN